MGDLYRERNNLEKAEQCLIKGITQIQQKGNIEFLTDGYVPLARVKQAQGDLTGSLDILQKADVIVRKYHNRRMTALVEAFLARFHLTAGEVIMGINWAKSSAFRMDDEDIPLTEIQQTTLVRVLTLRDKKNEALLILDQLYKKCELGSRKGSAIQILILKSLILHSQQRQKDAFSALEEALVLARPEHYVRIFADEGKPMARLLYQLIHHKGASSALDRTLHQYVDILLTAIGSEALEGLAQSDQQKNEWIKSLNHP